MHYMLVFLQPGGVMRAVYLLILILFISSQGFTQTYTDIFFLEVRNDAFGISATDRHLTNAVSLGYMTEEIPEFLERYFKRNNQNLFTVSLNQNMYTPEDIQRSEVIKDDRPYAGWLFVRSSVSNREGNNLALYGVEAGVVGPAALAKEAQTTVHKITDSRDPKGWDNQLGNEFGFNVYHHRAQNKRWKTGPFEQEIIYHAGGSAGNVATYAEVGSYYRIGYNMPDDMIIGSKDEASWTLRKDPNYKKPFAAYIFTHVNGRYVLRDIFLDGNTFKNSHSVDKKHFVASSTAGVIFEFRNFELGYTYTVTSEQFEGQDGPDQRGLVVFAYKSNF